MVVRDTSPISYISQVCKVHTFICQSLTFLFRDNTFHLALALFASLRQKHATCYFFTFANPKQLSDVILRRTSLSCPLAAIPLMRPDCLLRLWRYVNPLLT